MIWRVIKIVLILLLPAYFIFAYVYAQIEYADEVCSDIRVILLNEKEQQHLSRNDIKKIISENHLINKGDKLNSINRETVEKTIEANMLVQNAECYFTPSGSVVIEVEQRIPALRVITPSGSYYVDKNRELMPISSKVLAYVPVATGNISETFAKNELFDFSEYIANHKIWQKQIEQIVVKDNEEIELVPKIGKQLILFGKISNFETKFKSVELLYSKVFNKIGWNYYNKVSLQYDGKIICTKNK